MASPSFATTGGMGGHHEGSNEKKIRHGHFPSRGTLKCLPGFHGNLLQRYFLARPALGNNTSDILIFSV